VLYLISARRLVRQVSLLVESARDDVSDRARYLVGSDHARARTLRGGLEIE